MGRFVLNLIGDTFGRLLVLERMSATRHLCRCACGTEKAILTSSLTRKNGASKSCGCLQREAASGLFREHGESNPPTLEYTAWQNMKARCFDRANTKYKDYGGRGITVSPRWQIYNYFIQDMGRKPSKDHSLDRIDNNGNYERGNCRWATQSEQMLNRRSWTWSEQAKKDFKRRACHRISAYK